MISFRNHVVTLVSVFLALAVGVVLGGGPLGEVGREVGDDTDVQQLEATASASNQRADFGERFAGTTAASLYAGRLAEREVVVLTLPGADEAVVESLVEEVRVAGGSVIAQQQLGDAMVDPAEKSLVETLGSQLVDQLPKETVGAEVPTYERMGQLIGFAVASPEAEGEGRNASTAAVLEGLRGAGLLPEVAPAERRAPLVLVVTGDEVDGEGGDDILGGLVRGLSARSVGTVVTGGTDAGAGQLGRLRTAAALGTATSVDGVETAPGRVATVLALIRALSADGGAFGASGADGPVPLG